GNMTTMPQPASPASSYTATYDAWNRLVKIADGGNTVSEYQYDGAKRRVVQKSYVSGTLNETRHLYYTEPSKWQVVEERGGTSTSANRQFVWGLRYIDDLILRDRDTDGNGTLDERLYSLQDANWNVTGLVNTSGVIQQRFVYTAYGLPVFLSSSFTAGSNTAAWEVLYAGYRFETATSLMHVRHRVLNAALGCWVQRDPIGYLMGLGLYEYAASDPVDIVDASGMGWRVVGTELAICVGTQIGGGRCLFKCACPLGSSPDSGVSYTYKRPCDHPPSPHCLIWEWQPDPICIRVPNTGLIEILIALLGAAAVIACFATGPCAAAAAGGASAAVLVILIGQMGGGSGTA
ncbi:MAG: RHS repeat domain-containing protein, partial [Planctomyces sp.]